MNPILYVIAYPTKFDLETCTHEIGRTVVATLTQFDEALRIYRDPQRFLDFRSFPSYQDLCPENRAHAAVFGAIEAKIINSLAKNPLTTAALSQTIGVSQMEVCLFILSLEHAGKIGKTSDTWTLLRR